jgi:hypothetical protein
VSEALRFRFAVLGLPDLEDESITFLLKVADYSPEDTASLFGRLESSATRLLVPQSRTTVQTSRRQNVALCQQARPCQIAQTSAGTFTELGLEITPHAARQLRSYMEIQMSSTLVSSNFHSFVLLTTDTEREQVPTCDLLFYWLRCTNQNLDFRTNLKHLTEILEQI